MSFAYFISESKLKENSPIDDNVDPKLLRTAMRTAQDIYIRDIVGSGIYDDLVTSIITPPLSANYTALMDNYIHPCLIHYVISEAMLPMTFKFQNKTVSTRNADNVNTVTIEDIVTIQNHYKDRAEYYKDRLVAYLCANPTLFPKYLNAGSGVDTVHPSDVQFFGGFFFDGSEPQGNYDYEK